MTEEEAVAKVKFHALVDEEPRLSDEDVLLLVRSCRLQDADGNPPVLDGDDNPAWVPKYWINRAIFKCWERKLALTAQWVDVSADGANFAQSQAVAAIAREAARWRSRCGSGI